jgi:hypothetical protein
MRRPAAAAADVRPFRAAMFQIEYFAAQVILTLAKTGFSIFVAATLAHRPRLGRFAAGPFHASP